MSLKQNIFANYASQIYLTLIGIVMLPVYIRYMGVEVYGLVGFFAVLQAWFLLLDMGLTPTMARETARFRGGASDAQSLRHLLRSLEMVFLAIAVLGGASLILGADWIAGNWLRVEQLPIDEVSGAITLMVLVMALRWMSELYRSVIAGFERMVWLGVFSIAIGTVRFVLVIPLFVWVGSGIGEFFLFQLCVSIVEAAVLTGKAYALLPDRVTGAPDWNWQPLRNVMRFSLAMAFATVVWVCVSQFDKLMLSGLLSLADYGWFSMTTLAASGVLLLTSPIVAALMPRFSALHAQGDDGKMLLLYRTATQWVGLLAWPVCGILAWQAERALWIWTGDTHLAALAASTLCMYALGNGAMALSAFPYYLQFAKGDLRLHLIGTGLFVLVLLPCLVWGVNLYGAAGAGWAWLSVNVFYFVLWIPVAHARHAPGLHLRWMLQDVAPVAVLALASAFASRWIPWPDDRALAGIQLLAVSGVVLVIAGMGSPWLRFKLANFRRYENLEWQG